MKKHNIILDLTVVPKCMNHVVCPPHELNLFCRKLHMIFQLYNKLQI